jgi:predicted nucleic acid-binding protein
MTLVVDASVATKWVMPEENSGRATALRDQSDDLIAPALIESEIGNAIWKRVMWREVRLRDAVLAAEIALGLITRLVPIDDLVSRALEIAVDLQHPIYDCFYLALAEREHARLVCADRPLIEKAKKLKGIEVRAL